jgi:pimeloyl-ACP methyl ester carboxylesterase
MIVTNDGLDLVVDSAGSGTPVLFVHGTTGSAADYVLVAPHLVEVGLRVITYDRRGRGRSEDADEYSFEAEVGDLHAVIDAVGEPLHLVGHSYGALLSLAAAAERGDLLSLTLYEPGLSPEAIPAEQWDEIDAADQERDWERVLMLFQPVAGMPAEETAFFRSIAPVWKAFLDGARTAGREIRAIRATGFDPQIGARVVAPAQLLVGELTESPLFLDRLDELSTQLRAEVRRIPGARHVAMANAPGELASAITAFALLHAPLAETERPPRT